MDQTAIRSLTDFKAAGAVLRVTCRSCRRVIHYSPGEIMRFYYRVDWHQPLQVVARRFRCTACKVKNALLEPAPAHEPLPAGTDAVQLATMLHKLIIASGQCTQRDVHDDDLRHVLRYLLRLKPELRADLVAYWRATKWVEGLPHEKYRAAANAHPIARMVARAFRREGEPLFGVGRTWEPYA